MLKISGFPFVFLLLLTLIETSVAQRKTTNPCLPALSQFQRDSIQLPKEGFMIYNTTTGCINYFGKQKWREFCPKENEVQTTKGTVNYDKENDRFTYFDGSKWIPFETYAAEIRKKNGKEATEDEEIKDEKVKQAEGGNGELFLSGSSTEVKKPTINDKTDCSKPPTESRAGPNLVSLDKIQLAANKAAHGKGVWLIVKGNGGMLTDSADPRSMFSGVQGTSYQLRWQISTKCDTSFDETIVRIRFPCEPEPSVSFAGIDKFNVTECYLSANEPESGVGSWKIAEGVGGKIMDTANPFSQFIGIEGNTYILKWIIRTKCGYTEDDVKITFKPPCRPKPSKAMAGGDQIDVESCVLMAEEPEFGKGRWTVIKGKKGLILKPGSYNSVFEGEAETAYLLEWSVSNDCGITRDTVKVTFSKRCPKTITDIRDGQVYRVTLIGNQCWMSDNLSYKGVENYCYNFEAGNCERYGALYTWQAAMNGKNTESSQGACPDGFHVPSDKEWEELTSAPGINNESLRINGGSNFDLVHGGTRYPNGTFFNKNQYAYFWSSTETTDGTALNRYFNAEGKESAHFSTNKENGFSVRCIQD